MTCNTKTKQQNTSQEIYTTCNDYKQTKIAFGQESSEYTASVHQI